MIHDATGKFSSRWVLPDRRSLAVVIQNRLHGLNIAIARDVMNNGTQDRWRTPYMGNSPAKPMLSGEFRRALRAVLLSVVGQHLAAVGGKLGAVLLQARQNGEIALVHQGTAKALDVARARPLLLGRAAALLLGESAARDRYRQQRERKENFSQGVLSLTEISRKIA